MVHLAVEPLDAAFGARITGISLADIDDDTFAELNAQWLDRGLLVFPGQHLSHAEQIAFGRRFGELEIELAELSNVRPDGSLRSDDGTDDMMKVHRGNMGWHHDSTYMPIQAKGAVFSAEVVPSEGGATGFADMRAAYDALDGDTQQRLEGLRAHHSLYHSQAQVGHLVHGAGNGTVTASADADSSYGGYGFHDGPVSVRPLVKVHPDTGRRNLLIGRHAYDIVGLGDDESTELLADLTDFACQPSRTYHHQWEAGDVVVWDNRRLMHRATPWPLDQARIMWHTRLAGDPATESALTD